MKTQTIFFLLVLLCSFNLHARPKVIYGTDSRIDVSDSRSGLHRLKAKSVAALVPNNAIFKSGEFSHLASSTLYDKNICSNQRFSHQQAVSTCTGFLIGKNRLVTAGHCINENECKTHKWVFDYQLDSGKDSFVGQIENKHIYGCKRVVDWKKTFFFKQDWAVIELDRPVLDRAPLGLSNKIPRPGTALFTIGTPSGLPLKIATGNVRKLNVAYLTANLDTFGGNSGSPVFNAQTGLVEGILVRGQKDYRKTASGCSVVNQYPENGGRGEDVTFIDVVKNK